VTRIANLFSSLASLAVATIELRINRAAPFFLGGIFSFLGGGGLGGHGWLVKSYSLKVKGEKEDQVTAKSRSRVAVLERVSPLLNR
jgi:hypothetical protein